MHELTGIAFSHYVEKARWALDRFAVPYRDRRVLPFLHFAAVYRVHRGKVARADKHSTRFSTPVLETDDGKVLCDSHAILRYASERYAPPGEELYALPEAGELERHFDQELGPYTRRAAYGALLERPELLKELAQRNVGRLQAAAFTAALPLVKVALLRGLGIEPRRVVKAWERVERELERVSERLGDGRPFLLGDRFSAADLTFAALSAPALAPGEYSAWLPPPAWLSEADTRRIERLRQTPAGAFVMRMFRDERRRVVRARTA